MEKKIQLIVFRKNSKFVYVFDTVEQAYSFYVKTYATLKEWWYYFTCAYKPLSLVKDEKVMKCIFENCFLNTYIQEI